MQVTWTWLLSKSCFNRYSINSQNRSFDSGIWLNYRTFNRSGATPVVAFDVTKDFSRVWLAGRLHKLTSYGILCRVFCIISSFLSSRWLRAVLNGKFSQDSPVNAAVSPGFTLGPTFFLLYINDYSMCNKAFYLWELIEFTSERESDLRHQGGLGSGSLISMLKKLNLFHLICLVVLLIWQWMGLLLNKNHLLRCWDCHSLLNWIMILRLFLLLKLLPWKLEPEFVLWSFCLVRFLFISINLPKGFAWNTVAGLQITAGELPGIIEFLTTCFVQMTS